MYMYIYIYIYTCNLREFVKLLTPGACEVGLRTTHRQACNWRGMVGTTEMVGGLSASRAKTSHDVGCS